MKIFTLVIFLVFVLVNSNQLKAEWTKTWNVPVYKIYNLNSNIFALTSYGLQKSTDKGASWTNVHNGLPNSAVISMGYFNGNYFVGTYANGLFKSTDNGLSWTTCNLVGDAQTIKIHNGKMYVGYNCFNEGELIRGIWVTSNGTDFTLFSDEIPSYQQQIKCVWQIDFKDNHLFNASESGIFRANVNGGNWENLFEGKDISCYIDSRNLFIINNTIFWSTSGCILKSTNDGQSWDQISYSAAWEVFSTDNKTFIKTHKLQYTSDEGVTWNDFSEDFPETLNIDNYCIGYIDNKILIGTPSGLYSKPINSADVSDEYFSNSNNMISYDVLSNTIQINNARNDYTIEIYNYLGESINKYNSISNISLDDYKSGIYFVKYSDYKDSFIKQINVCK